MTKIFLPPKIEEVNPPLIFLAGPIQGAEHWQNKGRRDYLDGEFVYEAQVDWETRYLNEAAKKGLILFWLAKEAEHDNKRSYAQTSRFELAEWKVKHERDGVKLVLGIEDGFTGAQYIRHRFSQDCPEIPILDSLEKTCEKAVKML